MSKGTEKYLERTAPIFDEEMGRRLRYIRAYMGFEDARRRDADNSIKRKKSHIERRVLTQGELARRLGVSQYTISRLEQGLLKQTPFSTGQLRSVIGPLHLDFLLTGDGAWRYPGYQPLRRKQSVGEGF